MVTGARKNSLMITGACQSSSMVTACMVLVMQYAWVLLSEVVTRRVIHVDILLYSGDFMLMKGNMSWKKITAQLKRARPTLSTVDYIIII